MLEIKIPDTFLVAFADDEQATYPHLVSELQQQPLDRFSPMIPTPEDQDT